MRIAEALRQKNRLISSIRELDGRIVGANIHYGEKPQFNLPELLAKRNLLVKQLIALKTAIDKANEPIRSVIYELSEMKTAISILRRLTFIDAEQEAERIAGANVGLAKLAEIRGEEYAPERGRRNQYDRNQVDGMIEAAQDRIEELQSKLEAHNGSCTVNL